MIIIAFFEEELELDEVKQGGPQFEWFGSFEGEPRSDLILFDHTVWLTLCDYSLHTNRNIQMRIVLMCGPSYFLPHLAHLRSS